MTTLFFYLIVVGAGISVALQQVLNAKPTDNLKLAVVGGICQLSTRNCDDAHRRALYRSAAIFRFYSGSYILDVLDRRLFWRNLHRHGHFNDSTTRCGNCARADRGGPNAWLPCIRPFRHTGIAATAHHTNANGWCASSDRWRNLGQALEESQSGCLSATSKTAGGAAPAAFLCADGQSRHSYASRLLRTIPFLSYVKIDYDCDRDRLKYIKEPLLAVPSTGITEKFICITRLILKNHVLRN